jgi:putative ABC transport system permease protein
VSRDRRSLRLGSAARLYRRLLTAYPRSFRNRFASDLVELFTDLDATQAATASKTARARFWFAIVVDTVRQGVRERLGRRRPLPLGAHRSPGVPHMTHLFEDLRHAMRSLRHERGLSLVIVATLALAIGANSAIFTVVNAVLLRPLPYAQPDRVVALFEVDPRGRDTGVSVANFEDWRQRMTTITGISLVGAQTANLTGVPEPDRLRAGFTTSAFFEMLGVQPTIGRAFVAGEDRPGAHRTAILTHRTWQNRFGADPSIVGRSLTLNNEPFEIIGVLPRTFEFPVDDVDVWMPHSAFPNPDPQRGTRNSMVMGRVGADVSFEQASAELRQVSSDLARAYPDTNKGWTARFRPFHEVTLQFVARNLRLLAGAVAFVLLIACANIANLLLTRASARQREIAVRAALGASRGRLVRQLLFENLATAVVGGALGLVLGALLTDGMLSLVPNLPRVDRVAPDGTVVAFTALLSLATGLLFGILPALRTSRPDLRTSLSEGTRGGESRATARWRSTLVVAELALSLILLVGAGLLIQSLTRLMTVDLGYNPENLLTLEYRMPRNKYSTAQQQWEFHRRVIDEIARVPGVRISSLARAIPQSGNGGFVGYWKAEDAMPSREDMPRAQVNTVSANYFAVMNIPVFEGRVCGATDVPDAPINLIVNRFLAERLWPRASAVGQRLRSPDFPGEAVVIGVVGNTRPQLLSMPIGGQIYGCFSQQSGIFASVIARTDGEPMAVSRAVQQAIWTVDPDQPMWKIRSSETLVSGSIQTQRFVMLLMSFAAALALLLAGLGTYSVLSYTVQRRAREVGVRMALGATQAAIARLMLGHTAALTALGVGLGLAGALAMTRFITAQLYEVSPRDPLTLLITAGTLVVVALTAAWLPMRRATRVDPIVTLRTE